MFLSVIIPIYNAEKYLSECLESLLEQDLSREDYEIICINDGSTDCSLEILKEYAEYTGIIRTPFRYYPDSVTVLSGFSSGIIRTAF